MNSILLKINYLKLKYLLIKCYSFIIIILLLIFFYNKYKINIIKLKKTYSSKNYTKYNLTKFKNNKKIKLLINKEKNDLLKFLSENSGKNITKIKRIFLNNNKRFGNQFILFNKVIFFCEILGCKQILLNKKYYWYIKNRIYHRKHKMIIEPSELKYNDNSKIIDKTFIFFHYANIFKGEFRISLLKNEIIKNLPVLNINITIKDLFIYIRSGDIFMKTDPCTYYAQPPYCFYEKILINNNYTKIYLISENKKNPVINRLLNSYPNLIYNINDIKIDMVYLIKAYNIVGTKSTFLKCLIELNDNLQILYEYDLYFNDKYDKTLKTFNFQKKDYIIYKMKSSKKYKKMMRKWKNTKSQRKLMLKEKCLYNFSVITKK